MFDLDKDFDQKGLNVSDEENKALNELALFVKSFIASFKESAGMDCEIGFRWDDTNKLVKMVGYTGGSMPLYARWDAKDLVGLNKALAENPEGMEDTISYDGGDFG